MSRVTGTALTTINSPVDEHCEVRRDPAKDADVRAYVKTLLAIDEHANQADLNMRMLTSDIHARMMQERSKFASTIRRSEQYDLPPSRLLKNAWL